MWLDLKLHSILYVDDDTFCELSSLYDKEKLPFLPHLCIL